MISNPLKAARCSVCRRDFEKNDQIDRADEILTTRAVMEGKFKCGHCGCIFHGKCGRIGQVSSKSASVTCPGCKLKQKLPLPFSFAQDGKKKPGSSDAFIDKLQEIDQNRNQNSVEGDSTKNAGRGMFAMTSQDTEQNAYSPPSRRGASRLRMNVSGLQGGGKNGLLAILIAAVPGLLIDALFVSDAWRVYNKGWPMLTWGGALEIVLGIAFLICVGVSLVGLVICYLNLPSRSCFIGVSLAVIFLTIHAGSVYYARLLLFSFG